MAGLRPLERAGIRRGATVAPDESHAVPASDPPSLPLEQLLDQVMLVARNSKPRGPSSPPWITAMIASVMPSDGMRSRTSGPARPHAIPSSCTTRGRLTDS